MRHQLTSFASEVRRSSTASERRVWYWLRHRYLGGHKFRRQHPLDDYILDFYCAALKLCIEVDGTSHDTEARVEYDARRSAYLAKKGVTVLRLRNEHIAEQPDGAWSLIVDAVQRAAARSS
ncbi:MAG TPA: endonuclease domain-containing protein [Thermoanaerobaculia bacterium]